MKYIKFNIMFIYELTSCYHKHVRVSAWLSGKSSVQETSTLVHQ